MATDFRSPQSNAPDSQRATVGWWGIGSMTSAALAAAFLPASMLAGSSWATQIWQAEPLWVICCIIGIATGIRGMQKQRFATSAQRLLAFAGTLLSLLIFVLFSLISLMANT